MGREVAIRCKNSEKTFRIEAGSSLKDVFGRAGISVPYGPVNARVNNVAEGLHYRVYHSKDVEFLGLPEPTAMRAYTRTLFFVLCKAVDEVFPGAGVVIDIPISNGYYCELKIGRPATPEDAARIRERMDAIIRADLPIRRHEAPTDEAKAIFAARGDEAKAKLLETTGQLYATYYELGGMPDYFYGTMLTSTGQLPLYGLEPYYGGLLLRTPSAADPSVLGEMRRQDKMFEIFREHHRWQSILGIRTVGDFNEAVARGHATEIVNVAEALQEKKIARIAEEIAGRKGVKMVLIAGPSSSGKTTFCKRLSVQLLASGVKPVQVSLDDYFVDRDKSPVDDKGNLDFESLYALDLPLLNGQMAALMEGGEVEPPRYDFAEGRGVPSGRKMKLEDGQVLVVEGIHALNPELTAGIAEEAKYRVYVSALTTILLDDHNYIPTTDNRLLRRIVRDHKYRATPAVDTIRRWPSVRAGEERWIFPYQENADAMFNSAMVYELAALRRQASEVLHCVPQNRVEYADAYRLRKLLSYFSPITDRQLPPTSLLREFIGGSSFEY